LQIINKFDTIIYKFEIILSKELPMSIEKAGPHPCSGAALPSPAQPKSPHNVALKNGLILAAKISVMAICILGSLAAAAGIAYCAVPFLVGGFWSVWAGLPIMGIAVGVAGGGAVATPCMAALEWKLFDKNSHPASDIGMMAISSVGFAALGGVCGGAAGGFIMPAVVALGIVGHAFIRFPILGLVV
jgi:hypothetical protein